MEKHKAVHVSYSFAHPFARLTIFTIVEHIGKNVNGRIGTRSTVPATRRRNCCRSVVHSLHKIRRRTSDRKRKSMQATWKLNIIWIFFSFFLRSRASFSCKSFNVFYNNNNGKTAGTRWWCGFYIDRVENVQT